MWDSSQDPDQLIDEFLAGYYGPAAPHLREYLDIVNDAGKEHDVYLRCFMERTHSYLSFDDLAKMAARVRKSG